MTFFPLLGILSKKSINCRNAINQSVAGFGCQLNGAADLVKAA